ncbi:MAG TPA: multicopper oxidase domain-containing protein [Chloroflexia bacterium]|jgi:FtsP/CotA-like multicopper oxidase with cupredoxin domain|nr:multicopper oxidase domain-containing protein [Chloroflexia bacterium]
MRNSVVRWWGALRRAPEFPPILAIVVVILVGSGLSLLLSPNAGTLPVAAQTKPEPLAAGGQVRTYYIAADEVEWDYAPLGYNWITGAAFDDVANVFVQQGPGRIGKVYRKALYREYTDATFTQPKLRTAEWQHLGMLGPVIRGEVGDTIQVYFKNNAHQPYSVHPHGVFYEKDSEGAGYNDNTSGKDKADDAVPPGGQHVYTWPVPERAGPGPGDGSSILWMYHSHVDEAKDTNSGLIGPIIITARGQSQPNGMPLDVDREFVTLFSVVDENESWYLPYNTRTYAGATLAGSEEAAEAEGTPAPATPAAEAPLVINPDDEEFHESNLMHSINGYVYGNLPGLVMRKGERVRWYVMTMGTEVDLHTPHWHGQTLLTSGAHMGMRTDMTMLMPGSMMTLDMIPDNPGTWLFHCHVNDHITAGMQALFTVQP